MLFRLIVNTRSLHKLHNETSPFVRSDGKIWDMSMVQWNDVFCNYGMLLVYQTNRKEMTHYSLNTGSITFYVRGIMSNDQELIRFDQIYM